MRRILLDEGLPKPLVRVLVDLEMVTVQDAGWAGKENGELLALAQERFDVFLTGDRNIRFQQNLAKFAIGIVVVVAGSTKMNDLLPLVPRIREAIATVTDGTFIEVTFE